MECRKIQNELSDVACGTLIELSARQAVLAHVAVCPACAARLANERALEASLVEIARADAIVAAPARVKSALLAAYRKGIGPQTLSDRRKSIQKYVALAASVVLLAIAGLYTLWPSEQRVAEAPIARTQTVENVQPQPQVQLVQQPTVASMSAVRSPRRRLTPPRSVSNATETVTEYIPLTYLDDATAMESGQVVRIDVPRSSLAAFGLPVSQDRLDERVKADIIIGDDGLARAIRFVQ